MRQLSFLFIVICCSCVILFFSDSRPPRAPRRILTVYGLNEASLPKDVPFWGLMATHNVKEFNPPNFPPPKGGIFQPQWQNHIFAIFLIANIGSTPNFERVIEPHSRLRGWCRMTKL